MVSLGQARPNAVEAFLDYLVNLIARSLRTGPQPKRISGTPDGIDRHAIAIGERQCATQRRNDAIETIVAHRSGSPAPLEDFVAGHDAACFVAQFYEKLHDERLGDEMPSAALDSAGARPDADWTELKIANVRQRRASHDNPRRWSEDVMMRQ